MQNRNKNIVEILVVSFSMDTELVYLYENKTSHFYTKYFIFNGMKNKKKREIYTCVKHYEYLNFKCLYL